MRFLPRLIALALSGVVVTSTAALAAGPWQNLFPSVSDTPGRMAWDSQRHRIVAVGSSQHPGQLLTFTQGDSVWRSIGTSGTAPAVSLVGYDPARDRLVALQSDASLWELPFATLAWAPVATTGTPPAYLASTLSPFVDAAGDRIVVGGMNPQAYSLSLGGTPAWTLHSTPDYPQGIYNYAAAFDSAGRRIVLFGGCTGFCSKIWEFSNRVFTLSLDSWTWSEALPDSALLPAGRAQAAMAYDPVRNRLMVFAGYYYNSGSGSNELWALSFATSPPVWTSLDTGSPPAPRSPNQAFYDAASDRFEHVDQEVWAYNSAAPSWTKQFPPASLASPPYGGNLVADPLLDRMLWVGPAGDISELSLGVRQWRALDVSGARPPNRGGIDAGYTTVFDSARRRLIMFGGYDGSVCRNDVWAYSLSGGTGWTQIVPLGTPPPVRNWPVAVMDTVRDRMVISMGGCDTNKNDVWALNFTGTPTWIHLAPTGTPPSPRQRATAAYDGSRMIVFGGFDGAARLNDAWALSLGATPAWTHLTPSGTPPSARQNSSAIFDPLGQQFVIFAGNDGMDRLNDVWGLSLTATPAWTNLTPAGTAPGKSDHQCAAYDRLRGRLVAHLDKDWALTLGVPLAVPPASVAVAPLRLVVSPNPVHDAADIRLDLARESGVTIEAFDVAGRRLAVVYHGRHPAGTLAMSWRPDARWGAGIIVLRATVDGTSATARFVRVQ